MRSHNYIFVRVDYVQRYATELALRELEETSSSDESSISDFTDDETEDMELWQWLQTLLLSSIFR